MARALILGLRRQRQPDLLSSGARLVYRVSCRKPGWLHKEKPCLKKQKYMYGYFAGVYVRIPCMSGAREGQKRMSDPLEVEF